MEDFRSYERLRIRLPGWFAFRIERRGSVLSAPSIILNASSGSQGHRSEYALFMAVTPVHVRQGSYRMLPAFRLCPGKVHGTAAVARAARPKQVFKRRPQLRSHRTHIALHRWTLSSNASGTRHAWRLQRSHQASFGSPCAIASRGYLMQLSTLMALSGSANPF